MTAREKELEDRLEAARAETKRSWEVVDYLGFDENKGRVTICWHNTTGKNKIPYVSALVSLNSSPGGISMRDVLDVLQKLVDEGGVRTVPRWKDPVYSPVWLPEEINYSRAVKGATHVGDAQVALVISGGVGFHSKEVRAWTNTPEGLHINLVLRVGSLPQDWEHRPMFASTDTPGEATVSVGAPPGLRSAYIRTSMGGPDSWRSETYWETAKEFIGDALRMGRLPS